MKHRLSFVNFQGGKKFAVCTTWLTFFSFHRLCLHDLHIMIQFASNALSVSVYPSVPLFARPGSPQLRAHSCATLYIHTYIHTYIIGYACICIICMHMCTHA